jgi:translation initiation factor IF-1
MDLNMADEDTLTREGVVLDMLPDGNVLVLIANEHKVMAQASGKFRKRHFRLERGVRVQVQISPHDMSSGRLV